ncbi:hypothetical protein PoB_000450900 [Plakobranchus ocellatus]|uniref:Uncharacterized protein n=1 Tax=Plakobranchus ocellatus TaxID=259542 RepID=A0AAV3Y6V3_9GAST|nr:hypothetical protein PoB_000450900 [Plakobranchus ocellatus]
MSEKASTSSRPVGKKIEQRISVQHSVLMYKYYGVPKDCIKQSSILYDVIKNTVPVWISMASASVRRHQYPPPGILKASAPVRNRQYPPPGISKPSPSVRRRQDPHQGYRMPLLQSAIANNLTWHRK